MFPSHLHRIFYHKTAARASSRRERFKQQGAYGFGGARQKYVLADFRAEQPPVDFGQETVGWIKLRVKAEKGTEIKIRYAEFLNDTGKLRRGNGGPEGSVYTINLRSALGKAYYVTGSDEEEEE